jgi:Fe-Mn family superoxide dismutase
VEKLNAALEKFPDLRQKSALWLLLNLSKLPTRVRDAVHNNAGGHVNHNMFWQAMSPTGGGAPSGPLADAIARDFGSFDLFKVKFGAAGAAQFGSGWVWLVKMQGDAGHLEVVTTSGHDNPLMEGHEPLLLNDVWEHAYYLKHENRRADYLKGWWSVVNWQEAARRFAAAKHGVAEYL